WRLVAQESVPATTPPAASSPSKPEGTNSTPVPFDPPAAEQPVESPSVDPFGTVPQTASLKGRFLYNGKPPKPEAIKAPANMTWLAGENLVDESLVVAKEGSLANAVVW